MAETWLAQAGQPCELLLADIFDTTSAINLLQTGSKLLFHQRKLFHLAAQRIQTVGSNDPDQ